MACDVTVSNELYKMITIFMHISDPGSCIQDGDLRLVNGTIQQEGRAEICLNGVWGAICETGWTSNDAVVFCRELGYDGPGIKIKILVSKYRAYFAGPTTYYDAYFGETYGPVIFSNMACFGWENTISYCGKTSIPNFNCTQHNTAGVTCKDSTYACIMGNKSLKIILFRLYEWSGEASWWEIF